MPKDTHFEPEVTSPLPADLVALLRQALFQIQQEPAQFVMADWVEGGSCGTACCIGGWMDKLSGANPEDTFEAERGIQALFYMDDRIGDDFFCLSLSANSLGPYDGLLGAFDSLPSKTRAAIATAVVEGYIATGDVRWSEALSPHLPVQRTKWS